MTENLSSVLVLRGPLSPPNGTSWSWSIHVTDVHTQLATFQDCVTRTWNFSHNQTNRGVNLLFFRNEITSGMEIETGLELVSDKTRNEISKRNDEYRNEMISSNVEMGIKSYE
jgi:hypothetical protein